MSCGWGCHPRIHVHLDNSQQTAVLVYMNVLSVDCLKDSYRLLPCYQEHTEDIPGNDRIYS